VKGDLHLHTTYSDGSQTPAEALAEARSRGLDVVSFVDHDTTAGTRRALEVGARIGVAVIPGVEISAWDSERGRKVHILGYGYRLPAVAIDELVDPVREARHANTLRQLAEVQEAGYRITEAAVRAYARPRGCLYKQHIMLALIASGYADSIYGELYRALFKGDGIAAHDIRYVSAYDAIRAVQADGGLAVVAHPGQLDSYDAVPDLVEAGLEGIELFHEDHTAGDHHRVRELARRYDLITTGGSDWHGSYGSTLAMGEILAPDVALKRLIARESARGDSA
jgi:phosphoribosyl 1,2-cyclic phosphate 1,2-diphosphodiesterase